MSTLFSIEIKRIGVNRIHDAVTITANPIGDVPFEAKTDKDSGPMLIQKESNSIFANERGWIFWN